MKNIAILGSTGSIGRQTLDIALAHKEEITVKALAAGGNSLELLAEQIDTFRPQVVAVPTEAAAQQLKTLLPAQSHPEIMVGISGLEACATHPEAELIVTAVVGFMGVEPTAKAIQAGKVIALANKETLVAAGSVIMPMAKKYKSQIIPVDSEHSAIFQSLSGYGKMDIQKILLTASGGPFRTWSREQLATATVDGALRHPNWSMGPKITIDSATLMNKGLEVIEARWLFDIEPERIEVVVHPQSILHSAIEFVDGSIVGQLGVPDMRLPIHFALFYPERKKSTTTPKLDLASLSAMTFEKPDLERFPCLRLAMEVAASEDTQACVLNAANEIAVSMFLAGKIGFYDISRAIESCLESHKPVPNPDISAILECDKWARRQVQEFLSQKAASSK